MVAVQLNGAPTRADHLTAPTPAREILATFPAGSPRGSWPAEEYAAREGATVVMDLASDSYLVVRGR